MKVTTKNPEMQKITTFLLLLFVSDVLSTCENPEIKSTTYTTDDATILTHIGYISEFNVTCKSGDFPNLYVIMGDIIQPIGSTGEGTYQISWTEDVKHAQTGDITINLYDDDAYTLLKKAQRTGEDLSLIPPFGSVTINHPGAYKGPWISCECLAVGFSLIICYYAVHCRAKLLA